MTADIDITPGQIWRDADHPGRFVVVESLLPNGAVRITTCDPDGHAIGRTTTAAYYRFAFVNGQRSGAGYRLVKTAASA